MRMTAPFLILSAGLLAACAGPVPDSGAGVGFQDYGTYLRQQEQAAARAAAMPTPPMMPGQPTPPATGFSTDIAAAAIDRASGLPTAPMAGAPLSPMTAQPAPGLAPINPMAANPSAVPGGTQPGMLDPNRPRGNEPTTIAGTTSEMTGIAGGRISDEQDFDAVAARESIQSDAERIARNRAQYTVIQPTELPPRTDTGPNLAEYALSTTHNPGTKMYSRSSLRITDPNVACARYTSSDFAQQAFLEAGGPQRDRKGLDPDGDGFACAWDPRPFRLQ
jgi:hypothetical protein